MGLKEKLDVTLERPDVTLYGLIDLFAIFFVWLFLLGCVLENVCCCICFYSQGLYSSISLSTYSTYKDVFFKYSIFVLTFLSSFPIPPCSGLAAVATVFAIIHASKQEKPPTTETLYTSFQP